MCARETPFLLFVSIATTTQSAVLVTSGDRSTIPCRVCVRARVGVLLLDGHAVVATNLPPAKIIT